MKMKTLQEVFTFFYEKWKTKVKGFSKNNKNIELTKNQQIFDFPFDKVKPQQILSWLDYSSQGWMILSSDLTINLSIRKVYLSLSLLNIKMLLEKQLMILMSSMY